MATPLRAIPIVPTGTHWGAAATLGARGNDRAMCCAFMPFGLRSIANAGSCELTGNTPVAWPRGRPLPATRRSPSAIDRLNAASGHETSPCTLILPIASQVEPCSTSSAPLHGKIFPPGSEITRCADPLAEGGYGDPDPHRRLCGRPCPRRQIDRL